MIQAIKNTYFTYEKGEFLPIYSGDDLLNKKDFHKYKLKWLLSNRKIAAYQLTHQTG